MGAHACYKGNSIAMPTSPPPQHAQSRRIAEATRMQLFQESVLRLEKSMEVRARACMRVRVHAHGALRTFNRAAPHCGSRPSKCAIALWRTLFPLNRSAEPVHAHAAHAPPHCSSVRRLRSRGGLSQTSSCRHTLRAS